MGKVCGLGMKSSPMGPECRPRIREGGGRGQVERGGLGPKPEGRDPAVSQWWSHQRFLASEQSISICGARL